ncbi:hypothetical protein [Colwellia sp. MEBiC06753]
MKSETCVGKHSGQPLTQFDSEPEATDAADYLKEQYQRKLLPYKCDNCNYWHLTPSNRHTPSMECDSCFDKYGQRKQAYATELSAIQRAEILSRTRFVNLRIYPCQFGNGWHLTSS